MCVLRRPPLSPAYSSAGGHTLPDIISVTSPPPSLSLHLQLASLAAALHSLSSAHGHAAASSSSLTGSPCRTTRPPHPDPGQAGWRSGDTCVWARQAGGRAGKERVVMQPKAGRHKRTTPMGGQTGRQAEQPSSSVMTHDDCNAGSAVPAPYSYALRHHGAAPLPPCPCPCHAASAAQQQLSPAELNHSDPAPPPRSAQDTAPPAALTAVPTTGLGGIPFWLRGGSFMKARTLSAWQHVPGGGAGPGSGGSGQCRAGPHAQRVCMHACEGAAVP